MGIATFVQKLLDKCNFESDDFGQQAAEARMKREHRRRVLRRVIKGIIGFSIGLFIAKAMRGN